MLVDQIINYSHLNNNLHFFPQILNYPNFWLSVITNEWVSQIFDSEQANKQINTWSTEVDINQTNPKIEML